MEPQTVETLQKNSAIYVGKKQKKGEMPRNHLARQRMLSQRFSGNTPGGLPQGVRWQVPGRCYLATTSNPLECSTAYMMVQVAASIVTTN